METFVDAMPIGGYKYVIALHNVDDDTITMIGTNDPHELSWCGVEDIRDYYVGNVYNVCDDEGANYKVYRLI